MYKIETSISSNQTTYLGIQVLGHVIFSRLFKPKVEEFVEGKIESQHRFAAELLSSVTRGSKHWPFKDVEKMWQTILPLITVCFNFIRLFYLRFAAQYSRQL